MNKESFCSSKSPQNHPRNFPPLPQKRNVIIVSSLSKLSGHPHLHSTIPHYGPEIGTPLPAFSNQNMPQNLPLSSQFPPHQPRNYFFRKSFSRIERNSPLNCINEMNDPLLRKPSIEKKIDVPSTKENFTKSSKKAKLPKLKGSYERLSQSNQSVLHSTSFPNLEEANNAYLKGRSFMEIKPKSPPKKNLVGDFFRGSHFLPVPSIGGYVPFPSEPELKAFQFPNFKNFDKSPHFENLDNFTNNSNFNLDLLNQVPANLSKKVPSFSNLELSKNHLPEFSKKPSQKETLFKMVMPSLDNKLNLFGKFPSMKALESNKDFDLPPVLGKREAVESRINLPSLKKNFKKLSEPAPQSVSLQQQSSAKGTSTGLQVKTIQEKSIKPNSTTSLESDRFYFLTPRLCIR